MPRKSAPPGTPRKVSGRSVRTPHNRAKFLAALRQCPNIGEACQAAGIGRRTVYEWREDDEDFAKEWEDAVQDGVDVLEKEMWRRGVEGYEEPVFFQGQSVESVRKYSDSLAMFLAKGHRPEKYRERHDVSSKGEAIKSQVVLLPAKEEE